MKLKKVGFFDTRSDELLARHIKALSRAECVEKDFIVAYLRGGHELLVVTELCYDPIDPSHPIIGTPDVLTDGEWAWTSDVAYYVEKYNMALPRPFLSRMRELDWKVPPVQDLRDLVV